MLLVYRVNLWLRHWLRWVFKGPTPVWATDAWAVVGKFAFLKLISTILAIGLIPDHFFCRIHLLTAKRPSGIKSSVHPTPINFASKVVTLVLAATWFSRFIPGLHLSKVFFVFLLALYPVLMVLLSIGFLALISLACYGFATATDFFGVLGFLVPVRFKEAFWLWVLALIRHLCVPISPSIYENLSWKKMGWSLLYIYGYFISVPMFILLPLGIALWPAARKGTLEVLASPGHAIGASIHGIFSLPDLGTFNLFLLIPLLFLARLAVFPYTQALLMNLKRPTALSRAVEMKKFSDADEFLSSRLKLFETNRGKPAWKAKRNGGSEEALLKELRRYQETWRCFNSKWLRYGRRFHLTQDQPEQDMELELLLSRCRHFGGYGRSLLSQTISRDHISELQALKLSARKRMAHETGITRLNLNS